MYKSRCRSGTASYGDETTIGLFHNDQRREIWTKEGASRVNCCGGGVRTVSRRLPKEPVALYLRLMRLLTNVAGWVLQCYLLCFTKCLTKSKHKATAALITLCGSRYEAEEDLHPRILFHLRNILNDAAHRNDIVELCLPSRQFAHQFPCKWVQEQRSFPSSLPLSTERWCLFSFSQRQLSSSWGSDH